MDINVKSSIRIQSVDGLTVSADARIADLSALIKFQCTENGFDQTVILKKVLAKELKLIIAFCKGHNYKPP